jgi:hypothetical protein
MSSTGKHTQPVSGFSPLNFPGCSLWLDATSPSNFTLTGSNVGKWFDKSPFSNHTDTVSGGSPVLSNSAINGRPAVYFSNAPSIGGPLALNNQGIAGFLVVRPLQTGIGRNSDQRIFSAADIGQGDYNSTLRHLIGVQQQQAELRMYRGGGIIPAGRMNASNNYVVSWTYDGLTNSIFLNGVPGQITASVDSANLSFGSSRYQLGNQVSNTPEVYNGMIGEVIIYNDFLIPAQRQAVEGYLAWKWGIAPSLGTTFSPLTSLPSCAVWFDGADPTTFTRSGNNITQWRDKAGSNVTSNIGTPVYVSNAVGGVPGVRLDVNSGFQVSPMSNAANTTTMSIYGLVTTGVGAQNNARLFTVGRISDGVTNNDYSSSTLWSLFRVGDGTLRFQHAGSIVDGGIALGTVGNPCLMSVVFTGTTATLWTNGNNSGSINTTNTLIFDRIGIGKNINPNFGSGIDSFAGTIGEFLIFYAAHTEAQRLQVESYLASKWNVQMRAPPHLVPTHPYTRSVPFLRSFQPTDVPGCEIWMDAADSNSFTFSSGSNISLWRDKSGRGFNFSTSMGTPTYASNAVTFAGRTFMRSVRQMVLTGAHYVMIATKLNTGGCMLFAFDTTILAMGGDYSIRYFSDVLNPVNSGDFTNPYTVNGTSNITFTSNTYLARHIVEGGSTSSGTTYVTLSSSLADRFFLGDIYEVLLYTTRPSVANRLLLQSYLAEKWGIRGAMGGPAHPFRYGPPMGITPRSNLAGVAFWLDASDPTTMTLSGSNVTQWRDKSAGYVGTPAGDPVYTTVDGVPAVTFNGTTQYIDFGDRADLWIAPLNVFAVSRFNPGASGAIIAKSRLGVSQNRWALFREGSTLYTFAIGDSGAGVLSYNDTNSSRRLLSWTWDRSTQTLYQNGASIATGGYANTSSIDSTNNLLVGFYNNTSGTGGGNGYYFGGSINEILCIFGTLTTTQRLQIEGYLAEKWNLRDSLLPARHPYISGAPSGFTPTSISSCMLWLDAADTATVTLSGSNVTQWNDKSGNLNHFRTLAGTSPTYSSNQVVFPSGAVMRSIASITMSLNTYAVIVFKLATLSEFAYMISFTNMSPGGYPGDYSIRASYGVLAPEAFGGTGYIVNGTSNPSFGTSTYSNSPVIVAGKSTAGDMVGLTTVEISTASMGRFFVGSMYEVMLFSSPLTTTQRQQLEGYLAAKWGISASLPVDHPSRSGTPSILPTAVPAGCSLWLDAADASTLTLSGSNVTAWRDKSGRTTLSLTGTPPTYVSNQVRFNSSGRFMGAYAMTTQTTFFAVYSTTNTTTNARLISVDGNYYGNIHAPTPYENTDLFVYDGGAGGYWSTLTPQTGLRMYTVEFNGVNSMIWRNGSAATLTGTRAAGPATGSNISIGANLNGNEPFIGELSELIMFSTSLTTLQRQQVEGYLAAKWGLSATLPVGHPYLSGPQISITPATVGGCMLWLDAADASSYTLSGSNLTAITDKSPFAWPLGTPTNYTVNSTKFNTTYPSFFSAGTGQLGVNSNFTLAQPLTVYFAGQASVANSSTFLFDGTSSDRVVIYQGGTMFSGGTEFSATNVGASTSSHVISAVYDGSSSSMRLNGITTTGTVGTSPFGGIRISGRNTGGDGYNGHICELVICAGAHTAAQRQRMEGYLSWKWGIPFRLPGPISNATALSRPLNVDFDPRSVGGCAVWFDAADAGVIRFASGSNIGRWLDKSGFQNHLATNSSNQGFWPTYTSNTLNGKPVVTFSNAAMIGGYASPTSTTPHTIFVVARPSAITGLHDLFQVSSFPDGGTTGVGVNLATSYSSNKWFAGSLYGGNDGDVTSNTVASTSRTDIVVATVWPGSNINTTVNGTTGLDSGQVTSSLNTKANGAKTNMGAHWYPPENYYREFYFGYIAEVLVFSNALTVADRQRIEGYLAWKWGLQSQLPALHPFSNVKF